MPDAGVGRVVEIGCDAAGAAAAVKLAEAYPFVWASGKNKKAKELGIPILSEDDFLSQFAAESSESGQSQTSTPTAEPQQLALDF